MLKATILLGCLLRITSIILWTGKDFSQKIAMAEELKQSIPIKILRTTLELKY